VQAHIDLADLDAVILSLDGVLTRTERVHEEAWKRLFDGLSSARAARGDKPWPPFGPQDYRRHIHGRPRLAGMRSFLRSRDVELPAGSEADPDDAETMAALARRKNELFQDLLNERGVVVYEDTLEAVALWRAAGLKIAAVSDSRSGQSVVAVAGIDDCIDAIVDGKLALELGLAAKPHPDVLLEAARRLSSRPARSAVIEDTPDGIAAARRGGFGLVIGVDRMATQGQALMKQGADVVVASVGEIDGPDAASGSEVLPHALEEFAAIAARGTGRRILVFLDYDGTLTPIVDRPEQAHLPAETRSVLAELARRHAVAIVSGRDRADVARLVGLDGLHYAGSHGFDISGPEGRSWEHPEARAALASLDAAERELRQAARDIEGAIVERKRFAVAVHYRLAPADRVALLDRAVAEAQARHPDLKRSHGKKVFELRPAIAWDKGEAVSWLIQALELEGKDFLPLYVGDDLTDEDAFKALKGHGIGIIVDPPRRASAADYRLASPDEVTEFLRRLTRMQPA